MLRLSLLGHMKHIDLVITGDFICEPLIVVGDHEVADVLLRVLFFCIEFSDSLLFLFGFSLHFVEFALPGPNRRLRAICRVCLLGVLRDK